MTTDAVLAILARQQERRQQQVPTLSVIAGHGEPAAGLVRRWAEHQRRPVCQPVAFGLPDMLSGWFGSLVTALPTTAAAWAWLARRTGSDAQALCGRLAARSLDERALFLDQTLGAAPSQPADAICRATIEHACLNDTTTEVLWPRLRDACQGDALRATQGVFELVGDECLPILHLEAATHNRDELSATVADAFSLVSTIPALPVIVSVQPRQIAEYLATTPECRALAMVREGLVWLAKPAETAAAEQIAAEQITAEQIAALHPLVQQPDACEGVPSSAIASEHESMPAATIASPALDRSIAARSLNDDAARSAAERYLFERLQAHPATAGMFELNGKLEPAGGGRTLEIDLLARRARVAVEIDGYYHFTDQDAYRRDREKDVSLQLAGYVVVRCLADDVASRLEQILETILAAVRRLRG